MIVIVITNHRRSLWDSVCTCTSGRFLELYNKWCVSSLVGVYLFILVLPHVTSSLFVAVLEFTVPLDYCPSFGFNFAQVKVCTGFKKTSEHFAHLRPAHIFLAPAYCETMRPSCIRGSLVCVVSAWFIWSSQVYFNQRKKKLERCCVLQRYTDFDSFMTCEWKILDLQRWMAKQISYTH